MAASPRLGDAGGMTWSAENQLQRSIVCGVDGSDGARVALRVAVRLARELDARVVIAHVVQPQPAARGLGPTAGHLAGLPLDALQAGGEAIVDRIIEEEELGTVERRVVVGFTADRLADIADEEGAELIVVGSRGRSGFTAAWLGSVSTSLIGVARCPVLVVPPGAAPAGAEGRTSAAARHGAGVT
jgi:nucleotide-binding universal stress UspA family protein